MDDARYEIVARDESTRDQILSTLVRHPTESIAYLCLMSREPMSASEMLASLGLSDGWFTDRFNVAVRDLASRGLIRESGREE